MHPPEIRAHALLRIPPVAARIMPGSARWNVIDPLPASGSVGIELGVAGGSFSARMVRSGRFRRFFGVDAYADGHGVREYRRALTEVGLLSDYALLRMTFAEALALFPDAFFDFVYCDGYAHTGEEGGRTLIDWYAKLKPGGVMAGDDYAPDSWPLVVWAVNDLVTQLDVPLMVTEHVSDEPYNKYPSWYFVKPAGGPAPTPCPELVLLAEEEAARIDDRRRKRRARRKAEARAGTGADTPVT